MPANVTGRSHQDSVYLQAYDVHVTFGYDDPEEYTSLVGQVESWDGQLFVQWLDRNIQDYDVDVAFNTNDLTDTGVEQAIQDSTNFT